MVAALYTRIRCHSSLLCLQILWNHNYYVELYTKGKGKGLYAVTHHFFACKSYGTTIAILLQPNQPQLNILSQLNQPELDILSQPKLEDDHNGRWPKWKTTKMEDDQKQRRQKKQRRPKPKATEDDQKQKWPKNKTTKNEDMRKVLNVALVSFPDIWHIVFTKFALN